MAFEDSSRTDFPNDQDPDWSNSQADLGLNAEEEPSENAYESESAAPTTPEARSRVERKLAAQADWDEEKPQVDRAGNEVENGPEVDPDDPNLSATLAEAGAEERQGALGFADEEPFLDDPETEDEESDSGPRSAK